VTEYFDGQSCLKRAFDGQNDELPGLLLDSLMSSEQYA